MCLMQRMGNIYIRGWPSRVFKTEKLRGWGSFSGHRQTNICAHDKANHLPDKLKCDIII